MFTVTFNDIKIFEAPDTDEGHAAATAYFEEIASRDYWPRLTARGSGREMRCLFTISAMRETPQGFAWVTDTIRLQFVSQ